MSDSQTEEPTVDPIFAAAKTGDLKTVKQRLKAGVDPNLRNEYKQTPLMFAAESGHEDVFFALVKAGADLHATRQLGLGQSVLLRVVCGNSPARFKMLRAIIDAGGISPEEGLDNAFEVACRFGMPEIVQAMIAVGANVNGEELPLLTAIKHQHPETVKLLLQAGANVNIHVPKDEFGDNTHWKKTAVELAEALGSKDIVKLLQAAGAKPSKQQKPKRQAKPKTVSECWQRIGDWLKKHARGWKPLKKAATQKQIEKAEAALGVALPDQLRESYEQHNGSRDTSLFPSAEGEGYYLYSLTELVREWKMLKKLVDQGEFEGQQSKAASGIRSDWWNIAWLPFATDGGGDYYCVDLAPAKGGKKGQIITASHETGEHKLLARSFRDWLIAFTTDLEAGKFSFSEDEGLQ